MNSKFKIQNSKLAGQLMVEAIVALSILSLGVVGIFTLLSNSYGFNRISTNEYIAANLASEGIEIVRSTIDANFINRATRAWNEGLDSDGDYEADYNDLVLSVYTGQRIKFDDSLSLYTYDSGDNSIFTRKISITNEGSPVNEIRVKSVVNWNDKGIPYTVELEDKLFNWR